jgi:hypothetical protein
LREREPAQTAASSSVSVSDEELEYSATVASASDSLAFARRERRLRHRSRLGMPRAFHLEPLHWDAALATAAPLRGAHIEYGARMTLDAVCTVLKKTRPKARRQFEAARAVVDRLSWRNGATRRTVKKAPLQQTVQFKSKRAFAQPPLPRRPLRQPLFE